MIIANNDVNNETRQEVKKESTVENQLELVDEKKNVEDNTDMHDADDEHHQKGDSREINDNEIANRSVYTEIESKNQAIEKLKRQLMNQQIQLAFYLHKNLSAEAVQEFSNQCIPGIVDDNAQLSMAMFKFIRDSNQKTRMSQLREKLEEYNQRVFRALCRQETLLKRGMGYDENEDFSSDVQDLEVRGEDDEDLSFSVKAFHVAQMDLCSRLMTSTLLVQKELERFRSVAERIVNMEEERNMLIDRVFNLPADQRFGGMKHMDNELSKLDHNESSTSSVRTVSTETFSDDHLIVSESMAGNNNKGQLDDILRQMDAEAQSLLQISENQKSKYIQELEAARIENEKLKEELEARQQDRIENDQVLLLQEKSQSIEQTVADLRNEMEMEQIENEKEMKRLKEELIKRIEAENELEAESKRLKKAIIELQDSNTDGKEVDDLKETVTLQVDQIKTLMLLITKLNVGDRGDGLTEIIPVEETLDDIPNSQPLELGEPSIFDNDSGISSPKPNEKSEKDCDVFYENHKIEQPVVDTPTTQPDNMFSSPRSRSGRRCYSSILSSRPTLDHKPHRTTTSLHVEAYDKDGKTETMHAVLQTTSPVDGVLEMDNSSKLRLRLQCNSPVRSEYDENNYTGDTALDSSSFYSPDKQGDHIRSSNTNKTSETNVQSSREAKLYLSKQLSKFKNELETSKSRPATCKEIIRNINDMYSHLFGGEEI